MKKKPGPKPINGERMRETNINMTKEQREWVESEARSTAVSMSDVVRACIQKEMTKEKK